MDLINNDLSNNFQIIQDRLNRINRRNYNKLKNQQYIGWIINQNLILIFLNKYKIISLI